MENIKKLKKWILLIIDVGFVNLAYIAGFYFRFTYNIPKYHINNYKKSAVIITLFYIICFYMFRLYKSLWNYASIDEFMMGVGACILADIIAMIYGNTIGPRLPFSVSILGGIFSIITIVGYRMSFRIYRRLIAHLNKVDKSNFKRVLIIGAGSAGRLIIKEMKRHNEMKYLPVALIDDNKYKLGTTVLGVKVMGNRSKIEDIVNKNNIDIILIAIPTLDNKNRGEIINICKKTNCKLQIIPGVYELLGNNVSLSKVRDVEVEDLLGRETVKLDNNGISEYIEGKNILVTGGGGSIGSELCRQIARFKPKELAILDIYENNAYDLQNELMFDYPNLNFKVVIASIRDRYRLEDVFSSFKPDVVFHAAAHKHVPLMEDNPSEAVKNNIFGTLNVAECADKFGVKRFVLISTDKAVNPTNVMGATKRICEMIVQSINEKSDTEFVAVRFGNVLGSNGSVIPLFKKQIERGGPVTVTHKDIIRFFMTIPEAAQLVLQAGAYAKGGEVFVLDMGKPVRIYDLAYDLIKLSGLKPDKDIKIEVTGLRPGEKLYEEVLMDEEGLGKTGHDKIFIGRPMGGDFDGLRIKLETLRLVMRDDDAAELIDYLKKIVPTYHREKIERDGQVDELELEGSIVGEVATTMG